MSKEQQAQLLEFVSNFVALMHKSGHSRACALDGAVTATACFFGAIWDIKPDTPDIDDISAFVSAAAIAAALTKFYGGASTGLQA